MAGFGTQIKHAWNAFFDNEQENVRTGSIGELGPSYSSRPDRLRSFISNERSIITSIYTRIAIDVAGVGIRHIRLDEQGRYLEAVKSGLDNCLTVEANIDQAARAFRQDVAMTILDQGVAAIVPIETTISPISSGGFDIKNVRVGEVLTYYPNHVRLSVYNEKTGRREEITLPKSTVAIIENPLYAVMNEPNSTLQRVMRKLSILDSVDEAAGSGKLDLIIQLPYVVKSETRRQQAEQRRQDVEFQLKGSKYGIAYTDGTEKITQLNRPAENNLLSGVEYLMKMLYGQLGITEDVMNGTADEKAMLNYNNRTIVPLLDAITEAMTRTFLTKTARTQNQTVSYFIDPFKLVPIADLATIVDKFSRNEILSANEVRSIIKFKPSVDPKADELKNSNMPSPPGSDQPMNQEGDSQNGS